MANKHSTRRSTKAGNRDTVTSITSSKSDYITSHNTKNSIQTTIKRAVALGVAMLFGVSAFIVSARAENLPSNNESVIRLWIESIGTGSGGLGADVEPGGLGSADLPSGGEITDERRAP